MFRRGVKTGTYFLNIYIIDIPRTSFTTQELHVDDTAFLAGHHHIRYRNGVSINADNFSAIFLRVIWPLSLILSMVSPLWTGRSVLGSIRDSRLISEKHFGNTFQKITEKSDISHALYFKDMEKIAVITKSYYARNSNKYLLHKLYSDPFARCSWEPTFIKYMCRK